jgi:hypothetical protein
MRARALATWVSAAACTAVLAAGAAQEPAAVAVGISFEADVLPLLDEYCSFCHEGPKAEAEMDLLRFDGEDAALAVPEVWQRVALQLENGLMPPEDRERQPNAHERATLLAWIRERVDPRTASGPARPHAPVLRRLTRFEYRNTVRDVLGVDFPAEEFFPADGVALGFDHLGSALTTSDALVEKYFAAAERIADAAVLTEEAVRPRLRRFAADELEGGRPARGSAALSSNGAIRARAHAPRAGLYRVRVQAWGQQAGPDPCRMDVRVAGKTIERRDVPGTQDAPDSFAFELRVEEAGEVALDAAFVNDYYKPDDPDPAQRDRNFYVDWIEWEGPLDPLPAPEFQRALFARFGPELGERRARAMLAWAAGRLWRRPATPEEVERLARLAPSDAPIETAVHDALVAMLASPHFLFRFELNPPRGGEEAEVRALDAFELACRLSYFLWSSAPDEELAECAADGSLVEPAVFAREASRLLADARARALATSFAAQWLQLRNLDRAAPVPEQHPSFTPALREAMREETLLLFEYVLRAERSLWELLDADYTFVNDELAAHYGIAGVEGAEFRRVSLAGTARRGLLGHASVLTVTSTPTRTAPVKRGKFVLDNLLGQPLPPPPPGADSLDEDPAAARAASLRERLARHRADPACAVCHDAMDPIGFALENFDAIGGWRDEADGFAVDAAGSLPDGRSFTGAVELVTSLRADGAFLRCLAEKLLVYALGRAPEPGDAAALDAILARLDPERPTLSALILAIMDSPLFRQRTVLRR